MREDGKAGGNMVTDPATVADLAHHRPVDSRRIYRKRRENRGEMIATPGRGGDRPRPDDYQYVYPTLRTRHTLGPYGRPKSRQSKSDTIHLFTIKVAQDTAQRLTGGIMYTEGEWQRQTVSSP
jgi:hypothetical protein